MGEDGYDPLYKVRPLIQKLSETFDRPRRELAIDDMMIGTRCRIHFLQYIPTTWGIKAFVNAESTTGYVLKFEIYVGDSGSSYNVVMKLINR